MYGDGQINRGYFAWNGSGRGEIWFKAKDGENFAGEYTTIAPEVYHQDLSIFMTRIGRTPFVSTRQGFGSTTSNIQYGLASAAGDHGTTIVCKYIVNLSMWTWGFSGTGTCLDSKGKNYVLHASSSDSESASLREAEMKAPVGNSAAVDSTSESAPTVAPTHSAQSEQFAAFMGQKPVSERPKPVAPEPQQPVEEPRAKFYGRLLIYAGRIVPLGSGSVGNVRAEFEEKSPGSGTVRFIEAGNNIFDGSFTGKRSGERGDFSMITQKAAEQLNLSKTDGWGMISASDVYGTLIECVYGTVALSKRKAGLCEDTRGNKYRLYFD